MLRTVTLALMLATLALPALADPAPVIAQRTQTLFDPTTRSVRRAMVRVVDPHPDLKLSFVWEPATGNRPGIDADGFATGAGRLTWLIPGAAAYDPRAVNDAFTGTLRAGRPEGAGVLARRDGARWQGNWIAGVMQGPGSLTDADGNRYEGPFVDGLPQGLGIWRDQAGWTWTGGFAAGLRQGAGRLVLPGGQARDAVMDRGVETGATGPLVADATLSGLLKAQDGGDAGRTEISLITDARVSLEDSLPYTHFIGDGTIRIYPQPDEFNGIWNGNGKMAVPYVFHEYGPEDWLDSRAYLDWGLSVTSGGKARLTSLTLAVDQAQPNLRPMLEAEPHFGCIGLRADFDIVNFGWGGVENATLDVRFANPDSYDYAHPDADRPSGAVHSQDIGAFDSGADIDLRGLLQAVGVDTETLYAQRFGCASADEMDGCAQNVMDKVAFGDLTPYVAHDSSGAMTTDLLGTLSYTWTDSDGAVQQASEAFRVPVQLTIIEKPAEAAEMGDGGAFAAQAPTFTDVELPVSAEGARIDLPVRGNPSFTSLKGGIKLWSRQSEFYGFHLEAAFADGSIRSSAPAWLFFVAPRPLTFQTAITPATCYLDPELGFR